MLLSRDIKFRQRAKAHQCGQPLPRRGRFGNGVRLLVVLHLQPVLDITQEAISLSQRTGLVAGQ